MESETMVTKFLVGKVNKLQKEYRLKNEDAKKKNISRYVTTDVINRKGSPDIEDCILLVKWGNIDCTDEQAEAIVQREVDAGYTITQIFCRLCKAYVRDIPVDDNHKKQCENLDEFIEQRNQLRSQLSDAINKLKETINNNKNNEGIGVKEEAAKPE